MLFIIFLYTMVECLTELFNIGWFIRFFHVLGAPLFMVFILIRMEVIYPRRRRKDSSYVILGNIHSSS